MSNQIIKQPNGQYAIYSSYTDKFLCFNCSAKDIIDALTEASREEIIRLVYDTIDRIEKGQADTFEDKLKRIEEIHGRAEVEKTLKFIESRNV